jgi:hypothetical protein
LGTIDQPERWMPEDALVQVEVDPIVREALK